LLVLQVANLRIHKPVKITRDLSQQIKRPKSNQVDADNNLSSFPNSSSAVQDLSKPSRKGTMGILLEIRVVLNSLTTQQLKDERKSLPKEENTVIRNSSNRRFHSNPEKLEL
jgi:hypothetical protein